MTPEEKAKELVDKMYMCDMNCEGEAMAMLYPHALECALIAVDEILKSVPKQPSISINMPHFEATVCWEEVKEEIIKLK